MAQRTIPGRVRVAGHGTNILSPGFPRVRSGRETEAAAAKLYAAGFRVELADLRVAIAEPAAAVSEVFDSVAADTYRGVVARAPRRRAPAQRTPEQKAYRRHMAQRRPRHGATAEVIVSCPDGTQLTFSLALVADPYATRVARNRTVPLDVLDLVIHTLESWSWGLDGSDETYLVHKHVGDAVVAELTSCG